MFARSFRVVITVVLLKTTHWPPFAVSRSLTLLRCCESRQSVSLWVCLLTGPAGGSSCRVAGRTPALKLVRRALPWTVGLLTTTVIIAGNLLGGLAGYFQDNRFLKAFGVLAIGVQPIPYYIVAFIGTWFLGMRVLVSNVVTEDYVTYAEYGGVESRRIVGSYVIRNAMIPQLTALAMVLGGVFSGTIITEEVFSYPGVGTLLIDAVNAGDYTLVLAVTSISIATVATAATRTSCPAACGSASPLRWPPFAGPASSSPTSPPRRSTWWCRRTCWRCWTTFAGRCSRRWCS